jgi:YVTN family beta-propeller protein
VIRAIVFLLSAILLCGQDSLLLILQKGGSSLGYYSAAGDYLATVPVGPHPHEMVLSPDGKYLYCTDNGTMQIEQEGKGNNTISMVDVAARKRVEIPLGNFRRPHGIDIDRATGNVLVTTELPDQLLVIDPNSRKIVRTYDTKGKTSHIVTLGRGGKFAYVSNSTSSNIAAIEMATGAVTLIPTGGRPEGTVLSKDGTRLYTANRVGDNITIIDTGRNAAIGEIKTGKAPNRIALTPDGASLVYSVMGDQGVEIADPLSKKVTGKVRVGGEPVSLTLSP